MHGHDGAGRFALFGGPHLFESSPLGLLAHADNQRFLTNVLDWLLSEEVAEGRPATSRPAPVVAPGFRQLIQVEAHGNGERTIASIERVLRQTGVLKALSRVKWMP